MLPDGSSINLDGKYDLWVSHLKTGEGENASKRNSEIYIFFRITANWLDSTRIFD